MSESDGGPYTTLTVDEYARMKSVILRLRTVVQSVRELLEAGKSHEARVLLLAGEDEGKL